MIASPAATTARACNRPGLRDSRSMGPDTDTAATTRPATERTGAETEATPGCRSATLAAHPCRRTRASVCACEDRVRDAAVQALGVLPREQHLGGGSGREWQPRADRHRVAESGWEFGCRDTHPDVTLPPVELRAFAGRIAQLGQHRTGDRDQPILATSRRELPESGARARTGPHCRGQRAGVARARPQADARLVSGDR